MGSKYPTLEDKFCRLSNFNLLSGSFLQSCRLQLVYQKPTLYSDGHGPRGIFLLARTRPAKIPSRGDPSHRKANGEGATLSVASK